MTRRVHAAANSSGGTSRIDPLPLVLGRQLATRSQRHPASVDPGRPTRGTPTLTACRLEGEDRPGIAADDLDEALPLAYRAGRHYGLALSMHRWHTATPSRVLLRPCV